MNTVGKANLRKGVKKGLKAPHPKKTDDKFGAKTNYAEVSKTNIPIGGKKGKK